jgi:asparagine synthase (glutamine-hydrolysing)
MSGSLAHRGPDDRGTWQDADIALGHTRLSILDLSPAGHQPMFDTTGRYVMVYNGEVYNYRELRSELEARGRRFQTETDTEVLIASFIEWGPSAVARWNGMWALAIWDTERRELFASRDRAGKKPLFFSTTEDGAFVFGSEIKALRALGLRFQLDAQAAFDFLTQGTYGHLGGRGFLSGVERRVAEASLRRAGGGYAFWRTGLLDDRPARRSADRRRTAPRLHKPVPGVRARRDAVFRGGCRAPAQPDHPSCGSDA